MVLFATRSLSSGARSPASTCLRSCRSRRRQCCALARTKGIGELGSRLAPTRREVRSEMRPQGTNSRAGSRPAGVQSADSTAIFSQCGRASRVRRSRWEFRNGHRARQLPNWQRPPGFRRAPIPSWEVVGDTQALQRRTPSWPATVSAVQLRTSFEHVSDQSTFSDSLAPPLTNGLGSGCRAEAIGGMYGGSAAGDGRRRPPSARPRRSPFCPQRAQRRCASSRRRVGSVASVPVHLLRDAGRRACLSRSLGPWGRPWPPRSLVNWSVTRQRMVRARIRTPICCSGSGRGGTYRVGPHCPGRPTTCFQMIGAFRIHPTPVQTTVVETWPSLATVFAPPPGACIETRCGTL